MVSGGVRYGMLKIKRAAERGQFRERSFLGQVKLALNWIVKVPNMWLTRA